MIKKWLLPQKGNSFHPHVLRPVGLLVLVAIIVLIPLSYNVTSARHFQVLGYATDVNVSDIFHITNQDRAAAGVSSLDLNSKLTQAAQAKAADMFAKNYWAHNSPTGATPWTFITNAGYNYAYAAENLAMNFSTSSGVVAGWMGSSEHRANMLNGVYKDVGIAVMNGTLQGEATTLVVAMYGTQKATSVPAASTSATQKPATAVPVASVPQATAQTSAASKTPTKASSKHKPKKHKKPVVKKQQPATSTTQSSSITPSGNTLPNSNERQLSASRVLYKLQAINWGQKATLFILFSFMLVLVLKHTIVWRHQKRGWRHIWLRAHPIGQISLLIIAIWLVLFSGAGVIL